MIFLPFINLFLPIKTIGPAGRITRRKSQFLHWLDVWPLSSYTPFLSPSLLMQGLWIISTYMGCIIFFVIFFENEVNIQYFLFLLLPSVLFLTKRMLIVMLSSKFTFHPNSKQIYLVIWQIPVHKMLMWIFRAIVHFHVVSFRFF